MVVEYIRYEIPRERHQAFVDAYADAATELRASKHCLRYEVSQCVEDAVELRRAHRKVCPAGSR